MTLIRLAYLLLPALAMGASPVSVSTPVVQSGTPVYSAPMTFHSRVTPSGTGSTTPTGTITFTIDGLLGSPRPLDGNGGGTIQMTFAVGSHSISAFYNGDANYQATSSDTLVFTVDKASSWVGMSSNPAQLNQAVTLRAAPAVVNPATLAATGTVDFSAGGTAIPGCSGVVIQSGAATCNTTFSQIGTITVTATYGGDSNVKGSAGTLQLAVGKVVAGTYVAASPEAPIYGTPVTLSALLLGAAGVVDPTGTISFEVGGSPLPAVLVGTDRRASLVLPSGSLGVLGAGTYQIAASYSGDERYQASRSNAVSLTVAKARTTLSLSSIKGQTWTTWKATVVVSGGVAAGTVSMNSGGTPICTGVALQNGSASCTMTTPSGNYSVSANYNGDANTLSSNDSKDVTAGQATAAVATTFTPSAPVYGVPIAITAAVTGSGGAAAPSGTIAFTEGSTGLGVQALGTDGKASVSPALAVGTHNVVAIYSGDANYPAATATAVSIVVGKAATTLTLTASPAQIGQMTTLKATVALSGSSGAAGGTVSMSNGTASICTAPVQGGSASCTLTITQAGTYTFSASYGGDANTLASTGSLQYTVGKPSAAVSMGYTPAAPVYGMPVVLSAQVTAAEGSAAPTGSVSFTEGAVTLGIGPVGGDGKATATAQLNGGTHSVVATYSGDATYQGVTVMAVNIVVSKAAATVTVTATPAQVGQTSTLKATITVAGSGAAAGGTVSMSSGGTAICTAVALQNGAASCPLTISQSAAYSISATYSGDANVSGATGDMQFTPSQPGAAVTTSYTPSTPVYGVAVTITASVASTEGQPAATGTVTFTEGAASLGTAPVGADGKASLAVPFGAGTHSVVAAYGGDAIYRAVNAAPINVVVGKAAMNLTITAPTAQIAQPVAVRAAVTIVAPGSGTAGGTVDFSTRGSAIAGCSGAAVQGGIATCNTTFAQLGDYAVTANYSGDANTAPAANTATVTVGKVVAGFYTAATVTAPPYGAPVTVNALLMGAAGVAAPGGTVTFSDGTATLPAVAVGADGRASLVLGAASPLSVGTHSIGASYSGDANYQRGTAQALAVVVAKAATSVVLTSNPAQVGQPLNLKATVAVTAPGAAALGGSVDFNNGGVAIAGCTGIVPQNGTAACGTSVTQLGEFTMAATYSGDGNTGPSSGTLKVTVGKAAAGIYTASSPGSPVYGVPVTVSALLLGAAGLADPTGMVTFSEGGVTLGTVPLGTDGRASLVVPSGTLTAFAAGAHNILAVYNGDSKYDSVTAAPLSVNVAKAATRAVLTAGVGGSYTATITVASPGAGIPTGSVQFSQGGTILGTTPLVQQGGNFTAAVLPPSTGGNLWAVYLGDSNFNSSVSPVVSVVTAQVSISSDRNPSSVGQLVTFTARVIAASGTSSGTSSGAPGGSVQFTSDGANLGTMTLSAGQATLAISTLGAGTHTIVASYGGDTSFAAGTASLQQVVTNGPTGIALTSSAGTTVFGQPVTFTAQLANTAGTGTVHFSDGTTVLGSGTLTAGTASYTTGGLAVGTHSITASWQGETGTLTQVVNKAQTGTVLTLADGTVTAVVAVVAPGAGTPTGIVKFISAYSSEVLNSAFLSAGKAAIPLPASSDPLTAVYSGDSNFLSSTSGPLLPLTAVNAASYALANFAPDELATLFGSNLSAVTLSAAGGPVGSLGGTTVSVTDSAGVKHTAKLIFVSPEQVSFLMPAAVASGEATVVVANTKTGTSSTKIRVVPVAPGLFTLNSTGEGVPAAQIVRVHLGGKQEPPEDIAVFDQARGEWVPAKIDLGGPTDVLYLMLYGTGIRHRSEMPLCTIGGFPATVAYAGAQGSFAGLDQVNVALPRSLVRAGTVELKLMLDGVESNTVTLAFQ